MNETPEHDFSPRQSLRRALQDPLSDRGVATQAFAARHARLLIHTNIWRRPPWWFQSLKKRTVIECCALHMYARLIRRYDLSSPIPSDISPFSPIWLEDGPVRANKSQETEDQALARVLYIASFLNELYFAGFLSSYVLAHADRWNRRIIDEHRHLDEQ